MQSAVECCSMCVCMRVFYQAFPKACNEEEHMAMFTGLQCPCSTFICIPPCCLLIFKCQPFLWTTISSPFCENTSTRTSLIKCKIRDVRFFSTDNQYTVDIRDAEWTDPPRDSNAVKEEVAVGDVTVNGDEHASKNNPTSVVLKHFGFTRQMVSTQKKSQSDAGGGNTPDVFWHLKYH